MNLGIDRLETSASLAKNVHNLIYGQQSRKRLTSIERSGGLQWNSGIVCSYLSPLKQARRQRKFASYRLISARYILRAKNLQKFARSIDFTDGAPG